MTVFVAGTRSDALRVRVGGSDVEQLACVGTIRGVSVLAAAGRCGPGTASLRCSSVSPRRLQFKAPGSSTWGSEITVASDGDYLLEDGEDASKWARVRVSLVWMRASLDESRVFLADRFNAIGGADVPASEAASGGADVFTLTLANVSPDLVRTVRAWIDPVTSGLAISTDGVSWKTPTSETDPNVLSWASIPFGGSVPLYVRRTVIAGASPAAEILNLLQLAWDGL